MSILILSRVLPLQLAAIIVRTWHGRLRHVHTLSHTLIVVETLVHQLLIGVVVWFLLDNPHIGHIEVLLQSHHLVNHLLLQVHVLLLNVFQASWVIDFTLHLQYFIVDTLPLVLVSL